MTTDEEKAAAEKAAAEEAARKEAEAKAEAEAAAKAKADEEAAAAAKKAEGDGGDSGMSDESAKLLKDLMKQKERARALDAEKGTLAAQLKEIKDVLGDVELDQVKELITAKKDAEVKRLEEQGKYEQIVAQMREQHQTQAKTLQEQIKELEGKLQQTGSTIEELTVGRAFGDSTFIRENSALPPSIARREFGSYFEMEDGQIVAYNKPRGAAGRAPLVDANGMGKSFETALEQLYAEHPDSKSLLKVKAKPGAASSTDKSSTTTTTPERTGEEKGLSRIQKALLSGASK